LATSLGAVNLVSATSSVVVNGGINTNGSHVAIEAFAEIIANAVETNGGKYDLVDFSDFGGYRTLIASGGVTDAGSTVIESLEDLSSEQERLFSEIVDELLYYSKPVGEFLIGALYQAVANNSEDAINIGQFFLQYPLKLTERDKRYWTQIIEGQSKAFQLGRELGNAASIVQGIIETVNGTGTFLGGSALCTVGAGATFGISCAAGAPAMAVGAVMSAHGLSVIKNGLENDTDANLIDDLLAPVKMESTGGADGIRGLSKETGISQGSISNVYGDLSSQDIKLLSGKLGKSTVEPLFNQGNKNFVSDVTESVKLVGDDLDAIEGIQTTLRNKKIPEGYKIEAFSELAGFLNKYKNKVSGEFAFRFGKANVPETAALEMAKQNRGARGEINSAIDILEGKTILGDAKSLRAIPEKKLPDGSTTPDFLITGADNSIRLAEIKTLDGNISKNNIDGNLRKAIYSIKNSAETTTGKAYIRLDYRQAATTSWTRDQIFNAVNGRLVRGDITTGIKGSDFVEFVEFLYKDIQTNTVKQLLFKVQNGITIILN
jgi:hypothetical protein